MYGATRQAQRLADNFLSDVDDFQRASRAADRRAMSHFETREEIVQEPIRRVRRRQPRSTHYSTVSPGPYTSGYYRGSILSPQRHYYSSTLSDPAGSRSYISLPTYVVHDRSTIPSSRMHSRFHPSTYQTSELMTSEVRAEKRRLHSKMDDLLEYKLPSPDYYLKLKSSFRAVQDKMDTHRSLLDRYSGIDLGSSAMTIEDRVNNKAREVAERSGRR